MYWLTVTFTSLLLMLFVLILILQFTFKILKKFNLNLKFEHFTFLHCTFYILNCTTILFSIEFSSFSVLVSLTIRMTSTVSTPPPAIWCRICTLANSTDAICSRRSLPFYNVILQCPTNTKSMAYFARRRKIVWQWWVDAGSRGTLITAPLHGVLITLTNSICALWPHVNHLFRFYLPVNHRCLLTVDSTTAYNMRLM